MTDAEIDHLADGLKQIVDPRIVFVVEKDGDPVGFSLSLPDVNQVLHKIQPGPSIIGSYIGAARMLLNKRKTDRLRVFAFGVIEEYRAKEETFKKYRPFLKSYRNRAALPDISVLLRSLSELYLEDIDISSITVGDPRASQAATGAPPPDALQVSLQGMVSAAGLETA